MVRSLSVANCRKPIRDARALTPRSTATAPAAIIDEMSASSGNRILDVTDAASIKAVG
jgi:hypothetical protein